MTRISKRISVDPSLNIEKFSGSHITTTSSEGYNVVYDKYPENIIYATQRPSVNTLEEAYKYPLVGDRGRGIHYWSSQNKLYLVNDNYIYINSYSSGVKLGISSGVDKCYFTEVGLYLIITDPENNEGWIISSNDIIIKMTGVGNWTAEVGSPAYDFSGFPTDLSNILVSGIATLDGTGYVLSENGEISGCDIQNPLIWDTLNVISAEKEPDKSVHLAKMHDNIVVLGTKTIEFFWDAGNKTNSPLSSFSSVSYNIGCNDGNSVWTESDILYFSGVSNSGEIGFYLISNFKVEKISNPPIDSFITTAKTIDKINILGSGFSSGGRTYYVCTLYSITSVISAVTSLIYNSKSNTWTIWEHSSPLIPSFPLVDWTISVTTTSGIGGKGIFSNGDLITLSDDFNPQDTINSITYVDLSNSVTGSSDISFSGNSISSTTTLLNSFSEGDQIDITSTVSNNGSYIINSIPTATSITVASPLVTETGTSAIISRSSFWPNDYTSSTGASGTIIPIRIRIGHIDFGVRTNKICHRLRFVGDKTINKQMMNIKWSDGNHNNFNNGRDIDLSKPDHSITRLGVFRSRTFELSGSFSEQVRIQGLDAELGKGFL